MRCAASGGPDRGRRRVRGLMRDSEIREIPSRARRRRQGAGSLSFRCQPQVMGAVLDVVRAVAKTLEIEANGVTDNPLVVSDTEVLSGGNFHAEPVAFAADQLALVLCEIGQYLRTPCRRAGRSRR